MGLHGVGGGGCQAQRGGPECLFIGGFQHCIRIHPCPCGSDRNSAVRALSLSLSAMLSCVLLCCAMLGWAGWAGLGWALLHHAAGHDKYMQDVGTSAGSTARRYRSFWQQQQRGMSMQRNILRKLRNCCVRLLLIQLSTRRWSKNLCKCFHRSDCKFQCAISQFNLRPRVLWEAVHFYSKLACSNVQHKGQVNDMLHACDLLLLYCLVTQHVYALVGSCPNTAAASTSAVALHL